MTLKQLTPNLMVEDVGRTIAFYREILGFDLQLTVPEQAPFAFALMWRDGVAFSQAAQPTGGSR